MPSSPATRTGKRAKRGTAAADSRFELGPFWLWYRADRDDWNICWLDGRTTRRASTGVGGVGATPPEEAKERLADHWTEWRANAKTIQPVGPMAPGDVLIAELTAMWIEQHVANLEAPERYLDSVEVLETFWTHMRAKRLLPEPLTVLSITNGLIDAFIAWRSAQGASAPTISRDIAALRGPINWGMKNNHLTAAPRIKEVKGRKKRKELEWSPEQVAAILDAAAADEQRRHIHLFAMINLSTHGRTEAILELDADTQIRQGLIYFLRPDEEQTRKRRAIVPICPTLAPWLDGVTGKVIRYRTPTSAKTRAAGGPEWFERPTANIANGFEGVLLAAHAARPDLGLARQAVDADGKPVWLEPRKKLGETKCRPKMVGIGSPNTLRHTIHTWHKRFGVPEAQIDAAAGHSEQGTGASYTHLRPEYLREFTASTEAFWEAVGEFTDAHLRYHRDTNVVLLTGARVKRSA
jgi:site-specific recombinase XerD